MSEAYGISRFVMDSGERCCFVIDRSSGLPLYHPNLFLTTQLRNRSVASATVEAAASHLVVLMRFLDRTRIDLESRFSSRRFLKEFELDALRDFVQRKIRKSAANSNQHSSSAHGASEASYISSGTQYTRLTTIADYLNWYANHLLDNADLDAVEQIETMCRQVRARRPREKKRNIEKRNSSLSDEQIDALFEVMRPGSELNPFDRYVQRRNRLMILLLFHLGVRRGELLNLRIRDIDFARNQIRVVRRADEKDDPRTDEPNAKTQGRLLPLGDALAAELHGYITGERRTVRKASRNDFLFVTHKNGPTVGKPISKAAYQKVIVVARAVSPLLVGMSGHKLRHTWNRRFSEKMDSMDVRLGETRQEQIRSYLMGWKEGSGTGATYNRRFVEQKGYEAALEMQEASGTRVPERLRNVH